MIEPTVHRDDRGYFLESYHQREFASLGIRDEFVQDNQSRSRRGVLRGIHYQDLTAPMTKLVRCTLGVILDVAVDLRVGSPTFGKWFATELSGDNLRQLLVPVGFGHAFLALSDVADVQYKCGGFYAPSAEGTIVWNDPDLGVQWPIARPTVSPKDDAGMRLKDYEREPAFRYEGSSRQHPHPDPPPSRGREKNDPPAARGRGKDR